MLAVLFWAAMSACALKYLHLYQMNGYRPGGWRTLPGKWLASDALCLVGIADCLMPDLHLTLVTVLSLYLMLISALLRGRKTPVKWTRRFVRLAVVTALLLGAFLLPVGLLCPQALLLCGLLTPLAAALAGLLLLPLENSVRRRYMARAKARLAELSCKVVGITGSYGKTTTKNLLYDLVKDSFRTVRTPASYNTEMGVSMTVLQELREDTELFLCEMGARRVGDIDALCDIAPPDYAILTSVGFCHYKTFKSVDNIKRAKFELLAHTKKFCAVADTDTTRELWQRADCEKELVAVESVGVDSFYVTVDGRREFFRTNLLGRVVQTDLALALILAHRLGVDLDTLRERCLHLEGTPHRLQLVKNGSVTILDDSYNSNLAGVKGMVEVVKSLAGRKLLATCGMVELGKLQYRQNYEFATLCGVFDFVFVISRTNRKAFAAGLAAIDYPPDRVLYFKSLAEFQRFLAEFIRPGDVMVFENDLPDSYI